MNDLVQVVGFTTRGDAETHAFSWTSQGGMVELGTLGGTDSNAVAVNDRGQVFGSGTNARGHTHATLWRT